VFSEVNFLSVTVDCDLRCDEIGLRQESLETLLSVCTEMGVAGHVTWFVNENDFALTQHHGSFLRKAIRRRDSLGLHDHFESFKGRYERAPIRAFCRRSLESLRAWLVQNGHDGEVILHRNGCLVQHPAVYAALKGLGYRVVSEVWPGHTRPDRDGYPAFDNRSVPAGITPFWHDEDNFQDVRSKKGYFLHVPVAHMGMIDLDFTHMAHWLELYANRSIDPGVLVWLFHPYEILNDDRTAVSGERVQILKSHLDRCRTGLGLTFANMEELLSALKITFDHGDQSA
jgi:hypothetical protein